MRGDWLSIVFIPVVLATMFGSVISPRWRRLRIGAEGIGPLGSGGVLDPVVSLLEVSRSQLAPDHMKMQAAVHFDGRSDYRAYQRR